PRWRRTRPASPKMATPMFTSQLLAADAESLSAERTAGAAKLGRRARSRRREAPFRQLARRCIRFDKRVEVPCFGAVARRKCLRDDLGDSEERQSTFQEGGDGDLVRRVEGAWIRASVLAGATREREQRKRLDIRCVELESQSGRKVELGNGRGRAFRIRERVRD